MRIPVIPWRRGPERRRGPSRVPVADLGEQVAHEVDHAPPVFGVRKHRGLSFVNRCGRVGSVLEASKHVNDFTKTPRSAAHGSDRPCFRRIRRPRLVRQTRHAFPELRVITHIPNHGSINSHPIRGNAEHRPVQFTCLLNLLNSRTGHESSSTVFFTTSHDAPRLSHHTQKPGKTTKYASTHHKETSYLTLLKLNTNDRTCSRTDTDRYAGG